MKSGLWKGVKWVLISSAVYFALTKAYDLLALRVVKKQLHDVSWSLIHYHPYTLENYVWTLTPSIKGVGGCMHHSYSDPTGDLLEAPMMGMASVPKNWWIVCKGTRRCER